MSFVCFAYIKYSGHLLPRLLCVCVRVFVDKYAKFILPVVHVYLQVNCILRSLLHLKLLSSLSCALDVVSVFRFVYFSVFLVRIIACHGIYIMCLPILLLFYLVMQKCPFEAVQIINLPKDLDTYTTHRYGPNTVIPLNYTGQFTTAVNVGQWFSCYFLFEKVYDFNYRLPVPRPGQVLGLVGTNGIGKSTALKVLAGKLKPNLGRFNVIFLP